MITKQPKKVKFETILILRNFDADYRENISRHTFEYCNGGNRFGEVDKNNSLTYI